MSDINAWRERRSKEKKQYDAYFSKLRNKEQNRLAKIRALQHYSNPIGATICNNCGEQDISVLCIDHLDDDGKKHRQDIGIFGCRFYRWLEQRDYPEGFQVLCYNCNMRKERYKLA